MDEEEREREIKMKEINRKKGSLVMLRLWFSQRAVVSL